MFWETANGFTKEEPELKLPAVLIAGPLAGNEPKGGKTAPVDPGNVVPPACNDGAGADAGAYMDS